MAEKKKKTSLKYSEPAAYFPKDVQNMFKSKKRQPHLKLKRKGVVNHG